MKETKIDEMINHLRKGENLILESNTEMANHSETQRKSFYKRGIQEKKKGSKIYDWLIKAVGIDEEYLNKLISSEGL